jgi:UDP-3-O-[3-hydroxymyristoyl] glucosamine N-acyltransferase
MVFTAGQIAGILEGEVLGNPEVAVHKLAKIEEGEKGSLTFLANPKYTSFLYNTKASVTIVNSDFTPEQAYTTTLIKV